MKILLQGGTIVGADGSYKAEVLISGEKIERSISCFYFSFYYRFTIGCNICVCSYKRNEQKPVFLNICNYLVFNTFVNGNRYGTKVRKTHCFRFQFFSSSAEWPEDHPIKSIR